MNKKKRSWLTNLLKPKILIPILLTIALLTFAFSITDLPQVIGRIRGIPISTIAIGFGLAGLYLILKYLVFRLLLVGLGIHIDWRRLVLAYSIGEMCITIPAGVYIQNYVLQKIHGEAFARSAAATTAMLALEAALVLVALVIIGIPNLPWLRPSILIFFALAAVVVAIYAQLDRLQQWLLYHLQRGRFKVIGEGLITVGNGLRTLTSAKILISSLLLTTAYLGALAFAFFMTGHGVGVSALTLLQATTIYFFGLGVMLLFGSVLTQLGVIEVVGLGAAQAWGYSLNEGLAMLLGFRLVWMCSIWVMTGFAALLLRGQFSRSGAD